MQGPVAAYLDGGTRLHLHHGPIDLIIGADGSQMTDRGQAFAAAARRFDRILSEIVAELPVLSQHVSTTPYAGVVARRMQYAALPYAEQTYLTPMIAVAGAVADEVLDAMISALPLRRAYVNNGGDISVFLARGEHFSVAMASEDGQVLGRVELTASSGIGGIATSGRKGRSLSMGIADSVTVLAQNGAKADAAATLVANAVDLPDHPGVERAPAVEVRPDSDLGQRLVVTHVPTLTPEQRAQALDGGQRRAAAMMKMGQIAGAALFLQGDSRIVGTGFAPAVENTHD